jgi:hypothetical protein
MPRSPASIAQMERDRQRREEEEADLREYLDLEEL